jgi:hypothetical protein
MPLDGTQMFEHPTLAKLGEVECMLATEDQWCKGRMHDRNGRHCLVGALTIANAREELTRPIIRAIKEISGKHYWRIESFNDDPNTSHQDLLRVLYRVRLTLIAELARPQQPKSWHAKLLEALDQILPPSIISLAGFGAQREPVPVPIAVAANDAAARHKWGSSPVRSDETIDMFQ